MLDIKKVLVKVIDRYSIRTASVSGTTNGSGAISIASKIPLSADVLSVRTTSDANFMCIPWVYNNSSWYVKVVDWQSLASQNNKSVNLTIHYRLLN